jgi:protein required for attachment to host cells
MFSAHLTWVLITNSNTCRIYNYSRNPELLTLVKEIKHPENKLRDIDLTSDKPGRYKASGDAHGAYSQPSDPKEIKIDEFSREIAKVLDHGRTTHAYGKLIVIAPPHMDGLLSQHLNKHTKDLVIHNIKKDIPNYTDKELLDFLHQHI